jgi:hypothetical protein
MDSHFAEVNVVVEPFAMTTMERAFHLARSGRFTTIAEVLTALDRDGYG